MPLSERDYAKQPLPKERIQPENPDFLDDDLTDVELVQTADGYKIERNGRVSLGWTDVMFWVIVLVCARSCG